MVISPSVHAWKNSGTIDQMPKRPSPVDRVAIAINIAVVIFLLLFWGTVFTYIGWTLVGTAALIILIFSVCLAVAEALVDGLLLFQQDSYAPG